MRLRHSPHFITQSKVTGHSLSEYGLAIGLVVLVGISGLSTLGSQVDGLFSNMVSSKQTSLVNKNTEFYATPSQIQAVLNHSPTQTIDLGNGKSITIPQPNFEALQETLGPNGTTEVAIALLERMKLAMKAQGIDLNTMPEMAFFANSAHNTSHLQKQAEAYLAGLYVDDKHNLYNTGREYMTTLDPHFHGFESFGQDIAFGKNAQGDYTVWNYVNALGQKQTEPKVLKTMSTHDQMYLSRVMTSQKMAQDPILQHLNIPFANIWNNINAGTTKLADLMDKKIQQDKPLSDSPVWLSTKTEANKACLLSKETQCLK